MVVSTRPDLGGDGSEIWIKTLEHVTVESQAYRVGLSLLLGSWFHGQEDAAFLQLPSSAPLVQEAMPRYLPALAWARSLFLWT